VNICELNQIKSWELARSSISREWCKLKVRIGVETRIELDGIRIWVESNEEELNSDRELDLTRWYLNFTLSDVKNYKKNLQPTSLLYNFTLFVYRIYFIQSSEVCTNLILQNKFEPFWVILFRHPDGYV